MVGAYNPSTWKEKAGGFMQGQHYMLEFEASLGYMKHSLKKSKRKMIRMYSQML